MKGLGAGNTERADSLNGCIEGSNCFTSCTFGLGEDVWRHGRPTLCACKPLDNALSSHCEVLDAGLPREKRFPRFFSLLVTIAATAGQNMIVNSVRTAGALREEMIGVTGAFVPF